MHWGDGGRTDQDNSVLVCGHHHRVLHRGEWEVRIEPRDRLLVFIPPAYVDASREPRRNACHLRR
ncbi:MAG TPA: hypothetical protein VGJ07_25225 [Rugosimonospora sp.]